MPQSRTTAHHEKAMSTQPQSTSPRTGPEARSTRAQTPAEDGFITPLALAILVMVIATSLTIFTSGASSVSATRDSKEFLTARENVDVALARSLAWLTANPGASPPSSSTPQTATGRFNSTFMPSTLAWHTEGNLQRYGIWYAGDVVARGTGGVTTQTERRAWRTRWVGSWQVDTYDHDSNPATAEIPVDGERIYGVAAPGAWEAALSTVANNSWVRGSVSGDWAGYGDGTIRIDNSSSSTRVITYDDDTRVVDDSQNTPTKRSTLSATLDQRLLNDRARDCGTSLPRFRPSRAGTDQNFVAGTNRCYYEVVVDQPVSVIGSGVATIYSYGRVEFRQPVTVGPGAELHIYTRNGAVKFMSGSGSELFRGHIYAPNAMCKTYRGTRLNFTGAMACRTVQLEGTVTYSEPVAEATVVGRATQTIRYLESPGYIDRFTS